MGALMHQIDPNNYIVTIAVVDKYGELVAHKELMENQARSDDTAAEVV